MLLSDMTKSGRTAGNGVSSETPDEVLALWVRDVRDQAAFTLLVFRHARMFYRAAYRGLGTLATPEEAEDIVQEAYVRFWEGRLHWRFFPNVRFTSWFYRVVTNLAKDRLRRMRVRKEQSFSAGDEPADMSVPADSSESDEVEARDNALAREISALPDRQRQAVELCYAEGMSNKAAAEMMGVKLKAFESLLSRARSTLRATLNPSGTKGGSDDE